MGLRSEVQFQAFCHIQVHWIESLNPYPETARDVSWQTFPRVIFCSSKTPRKTGRRVHSVCDALFVRTFFRAIFCDQPLTQHFEDFSTMTDLCTTLQQSVIATNDSLSGCDANREWKQFQEWKTDWTINFLPHCYCKNSIRRYYLPQSSDLDIFCLDNQVERNSLLLDIGEFLLGFPLEIEPSCCECFAVHVNSSDN